ncbi:MAG: hypothetical protein WC544_03450 [Patescibacteria group bacterium]
MPDQEAHISHSSPSHDVDASVAGKSLLFYWRAGWFFMLVIVLVRLAGIMFALNTYVRWGIVVAVFALYAWWLISRFKVALWTAVTAGIIVGAAGGVIITVFELIWYHEWWYILNFIRQPIITGAIGGAVGFMIFFLTTIFSRQTSKGGGLYGRTETR